MIEHSKSIEKHDIKIACLYMQKLAQAILNIAKVGPSVREKIKLVIEKLSGRSVLIVLCSGKISGYIGQCPLHFVNDTAFSNKRGSSFILSRQNFSFSFSSKALLSKNHCLTTNFCRLCFTIKKLSKNKEFLSKKIVMWSKVLRLKNVYNWCVSNI